MKARPRSVEREVASYFSSKLTYCTPVERVPVIGRTGPDLQINESLLAIDVKSRKEFPDYFMRPPWRTDPLRGYWDGVIGCSLEDLELLFDDLPISEHRSPLPPNVANHLAHMAEWTANPVDARKFLAADGAFGKRYIPAIICHRPKTKIANAIFVMYEKDLEILRSNYKENVWHDETLPMLSL